ncbi:MAG: lmo0937 family membrane protein [Aridibacter famidurans]|nr:lmo0937 family membrane protein [Aridibacter famidurans]QQS40990.1 MAG: lmo0937 family membrane protein [Acidobacteriota bacterium]
MIWTIIIILLVMWLIGVVTTNTFGGVLHLLLVIALAIFIIRLLTGRRVT